MTGILTFRLPEDCAFSQWRGLARRALQAGLPPQDITWQMQSSAPDLLDDVACTAWPQPNPALTPRLSKAIVTLLETALCHVDPARFGLAYRLVWRWQDMPDLLADTADQDVARLRRMSQAVRRDIHKMTAFLRFREQTPVTERRCFAAWFEPEHHILHRVAPFFADRFADMDWLIITPRGTIAWDGEALRVVSGSHAKPALHDGMDALWRIYFGATFNPARIKIRAMQSEMPRKYWKNLPETDDIPSLLANAEQRVRRMAEQSALPAPAFHHRLHKS